MATSRTRGRNHAQAANANAAAVARAPISQPDILILDEPTASLDTRNAHRVLDDLTAARDAGTTILVASHDSLVLDWADEVVTVEG